MHINQFIEKMPKVELHVHMEGSIQPDTLITLAERNQVALTAKTPAELRQWYTFTDFPHFIDIYRTFAKCLRTAEDIEWIARQFLAGQAKQNILYSEVTYTPYSQYMANGISFEDQLAAINRARDWARTTHGVEMGLVPDISRDIDPKAGNIVAHWAVDGMQDGVVALGLGGYEVGNPPEKFAEAFKIAQQAGLPAVPHAGETAGPQSILGALDTLHAVRIGHGVRCLEDANLVKRLRDQQIPLEVCPTSNICLNVFPSLAEHALPKLLDEGLYITINSDDPPMFNTTLTREYHQISQVFGLGQQQIMALVLNAVKASLLSEKKKQTMLTTFQSAFDALK
ncbi:MAG: adenosine deaminase [Anaerolineaceae bacterium]|nr:adenosine deaminase [Anaerolineaceae bacterium]